MPSFSASTAYALCNYVDTGGGSLPTGWTAAWTPLPRPATNPNYAAVFQYTDGTYALVIQGTKNRGDAIEDLDVTSQEPFPSVDGAAIAAGTAAAMKDILSLSLSRSDASAVVITLENFLKSLPATSQLLISGHSLGGNVASAMAPWIAANIAAFITARVGEQLPPNMQAITFAAPTAGNKALADFLDAQPNYTAHFNRNDVVPHVWGTRQPLDARDIEKMFAAPGPSPAPEKISNMIRTKLEEIAAKGLDYTQTKGLFFDGKIQVEVEPDAWMKEMGYQHNDAYFHHFLGS